VRWRRTLDIVCATVTQTTPRAPATPAASRSPRLIGSVATARRDTRCPTPVTSEPNVFPELFAALPEPFAIAFDPQAPLSLLGEALDAVLQALPSLAVDMRLPPDVHLLGDRIAIGRGTRILPGAVLEGPVRIGRDCEIRPGAYIRGGVWIGDGCVVGASSEIKRAILLDGAKAPHLNYVGDSILGAEVNLGAGTVLSNFRHDGAPITVRHGALTLPTGRRKLGAVLGDGVATGCNCVLHPGVVVGRETHLYPGVQLRSGVYAARQIVKLRQDLAIVPRAAEKK